MHPKKKLVIEFDPATGNPSIDVHGAIGRECEGLTNPFIKALGIAKTETRKPEYNMAEPARNTLRTNVSTRR